MTETIEYKLEYDGWVISGAVSCNDKKDLPKMLMNPIDALINSDHKTVSNDLFGGASDPEGKAISRYLRPKIK